MKADVYHSSNIQEYYFEEGCFILELSNSDQDPAVSIARARVLPGTSTRLHSLKNITERYVILQGQGEVRLGNLDPQIVNPYDVINIPPDCPQMIRNTGHEDLIFLAICSPRFVSNAYVGE